MQIMRASALLCCSEKLKCIKHAKFLAICLGYSKGFLLNNNNDNINKAIIVIISIKSRANPRVPNFRCLRQ